VKCTHDQWVSRERRV